MKTQMIKNYNPPPLTKRIDLNVGYSCNLRCRFCYYIQDIKNLKKGKYLSIQECKKLIQFYHNHNMKILEFTGGEPTIREDFFELVNYACENMKFSDISLITNGVRLANKSYAKELVQLGVKDFLFSLHGSTANLHDYMTCVSGSYKLLIKAVENLQNLGVKVRCNSVVTGNNLNDIYPRAELFRSLDIKTVNFIMFNPLEQANCQKEKNFVPYSRASVYLKQVIDSMNDDFKKLTIRYMPLCLMTEYEEYVQNVHQVHYDHDEWNYYLRAYIREPYWKWLGGVTSGLFLLPHKITWKRWGWEHAKHAAILEAHTWLHKCKLPVCQSCSYKFICGGVWEEYAKKFDCKELNSQKGPFLIEPWHFMTDSQRAEYNI